MANLPRKSYRNNKLQSSLSGARTRPPGAGERGQGKDGPGAPAPRGPHAVLLQLGPGAAAAQAGGGNAALGTVPRRGRNQRPLLDAAAGLAGLAAAHLRAGEQTPHPEAHPGGEAADVGPRGVRKAQEEALEPGRGVRVDARQKHRRRGPEHRGGAARAERRHQRPAGTHVPVEADRAAARLQRRQQQRTGPSGEPAVQPKRRLGQ